MPLGVLCLSANLKVIFLTPSRMNPVPQDRADFEVVGANSFAKGPGQAPTISLTEPASSRMNPVPQDRADFEVVGANSFAKGPGRAPTISLTEPTPSRMNPVPPDRVDFEVVGANLFARRYSGYRRTNASLRDSFLQVLLALCLCGAENKVSIPLSIFAPRHIECAAAI
jgi:hypothetical protein